MRVARFLRSAPGRLLQVVVGGVMIWYGAGHVSLLGLWLVMFGVLPIVAGISNEYPFDSRGSRAR